MEPSPASLTTKRTEAVFLGVLIVCMVLATDCGERRPLELTPEVAREAVLEALYDREPVYAEVPQVVQWSPASPRDEFDGLSISTLEKMEAAGLVTLEHSGNEETGFLQAVPSPAGREVLGFVGSPRGPALRGRIATKVIDDVRGFQRHPERADVGRADLVWHYESPTPLFDLFDTKSDKEIGRENSSVVAIHREGGAWRVEVLVRRQTQGRRIVLTPDSEAMIASVASLPK